ncbi:MAG: Endo-1,4-beta-xylanase A precursor [Pelotomaculum sp. PtaB.Bin013]|nr:MAG: Endo-1,4-beta-xylanase A precursor [Pelotomaculum sp. PtaB.Bin013]
MNKIILLLTILLFLPSCAVAGTAEQPAAREKIKTPDGAGVLLDPDKEKEIRKDLNLLRLPFVQNNGQVDDSRVRFYADTWAGTAFVADDGITYATANGKDGWALKETFAEAQASRVTGATASESKVNYFIGDDKNYWRTDLQTYNELIYPCLYARIDLTLKAYGKKVEKVFTVCPGGNPADITVQVTGAGEIRVNDTGELEIKTCAGVLKMTAPAAYQEIDGVNIPVEAAYDLRGSLYGFRVGNYDQTRPLVIDPLLLPGFSTYLGGNNNDYAKAIAVDSSGNTYVAGYTMSNNFPTVNPCQGSYRGNGDVFVAKLNPAGTGLVYSTYLGGNSWDQTSALAVDSSGNTYIAGYTLSTNFPTANPYQISNKGGGDAFVAKLNPSGNGLVYSTYLGGSNTDNAYAIAVDSAGSAYLAGYTQSTDLPTVNPCQPSNGGASDAFVAKLNSTGNSLVYSTYLGGITDEVSFAIAVDSSGDAYVAGYTLSTNFPTAGPYQASTGGSYDAFVTKLNPSGSGPVYSTYIGGNGYDQASAIAVDSSGNAYIAGWTASTNFPVAGPCQGSNGGGQDAFVAKLNPSGSGIVYSTYLGGSNDDRAYALTVELSGSVYIAGYTGSSNFPTAGPCQESNGGGQDAFAVKFSPSGASLIYSTYLGGSSDDNAYAIAIDSSGNTYVAGYTASPNFPTSSPYQDSNGGSHDAFLSKLMAASSNADLSNLTVSAGTLNPGFVPGTTLYTVNVANAVTGITFTPTVADTTATVNVNGSATVSGSASTPIILGIGANTVTAVVYAQNGSTIKTYTIIVTRAPSGNADLSDLFLSAGTPVPVFDRATTVYTAEVENTVTSITVTPTVADVTATVKVNGNTVASGSTSAPIALRVGANTVTAMVYAQDGSSKTYTVIVNRAGSSNADLCSLVLTSGDQAVDLSPAFSPTVTGYSAGVTNSITNVNVTATLSDSVHAIVYVNNSLSASGIASCAITLSPGANTVTTTVYAQNGTSKTYTINVNRSQDTTGPVVSGTDPVNHATDVSINKIIVISFSQNIQAGGNFAGITLKKGDTVLEHAGTISGNTLTITPSAILDSNNVFTLTIPAGAIKNLSDNGLAADYILNFTTITNHTRSRTTSSSSQALSPLPNAIIKCGTIELTLPVIFHSNTGNAQVLLSSSMLVNIFCNTHPDPNGIKMVEIRIPEIEGAASYMTIIEGNALASKIESERMRISTCVSDVTVLGNMLNGTGIDNAVNPGITISQGDKTRLRDKVRQAIGNRPLIQLTLNLNGITTPWNNPSAPVTVSVSYKPAAEEYMNPEYITVWHIDGNGDVVAVPNGRYNPETGKVTFNTTHFSNYAVVYVNKTFHDMGDFAWAKKPVEVLASKGIINGTSGTTFSPAEGMTRADYLVLLVKTLDLTAKFNDNFDDVKQGDYFYEAVGTARKLGIAAGSGNNEFNPNKVISRKDMIAFTERALELVKKISATGSCADPDKFEDKSEISNHAVNSVAALAKEGLITGDELKINPSESVTRAEAAVFLYRIYNK